VSVTVVEHPLLEDQLSALRNKNTCNADFKAALHRAASFLVYEALRDFPTEPHEIETPLAQTEARRLTSPPIIVPVLRAGLGMLSAASSLIPGADTAFVGIAKDGRSDRRDTYLSSIPGDIGRRPVLVLDPMLATAHTMIRVCDQLVAHNCGRMRIVSVLAAAEGVDRLAAKGYDADLYLGAVDPVLNDIAFIVPGLGDAGDRQFGVW
jgi:uracil phosphoribosyltransferase